MSIEQAREILGQDYAQVSDEEIQALIDLIYGVCNRLIDQHISKHN